MPPRTKPAGGETARASVAGFDYFFYGTLCDADVRQVVLGRAVDVEPATLEHHEAVPVHGGRHPILLFQRGAAAAGVLCRGLTLNEAARLGYYEHEGRDYGARRLPIRGGDGVMHHAWVFVPTGTLRRGMGRWDLAEWQRFAKRDFLVGVTRAMRKVEPKDLEPFIELWRGRGAPIA